MQAILNFDRALASCGGDSALAASMLEKFKIQLNDYYRVALKECWEQNDAARIIEVAHRLLSPSRNFGAERIFEAAWRMEAWGVETKKLVPIELYQALTEAVDEFLS